MICRTGPAARQPLSSTSRLPCSAAAHAVPASANLNQGFHHLRREPASGLLKAPGTALRKLAGYCCSESRDACERVTVSGNDSCGSRSPSPITHSSGRRDSVRNNVLSAFCFLLSVIKCEWSRLGSFVAPDACKCLCPGREDEASL